MSKTVLVKLPQVDNNQIYIVDFDSRFIQVENSEFPLFVAAKDNRECRKYIDDNYKDFSPYLNLRQTIEVKY